MTQTTITEQMRVDLLRLLDDKRTGLKDSSNTNKTRYAILALFEDACESFARVAESAREEGREDKQSLIVALHALSLMYNQYCSEHGHEFMSAGEAASDVLEHHGLLSADATGRGEVPYDVYKDMLEESRITNNK